MTDMPDWDDDILGEDTTDDVIELTDIADVSSDKLDDGIIELTDIVEDDLDVASEESVIELTDIVEDKAPESALDETNGEDLDFDDDFSMDDGFSEEPEFESEEIGLLEDESEEIGLLEDESEEIGLLEDEPVDEFEELQEEEDLVDDISIEVEPASEISKIEVPVAAAGAPEINIGMDDIEAALDRVIEKKLAGRLETMLFEAMEKVIEKEILQIKKSLQKDLDQTENG